MKAKELISKLSYLIDEHGDQDVRFEPMYREQVYETIRFEEDRERAQPFFVMAIRN